MPSRQVSTLTDLCIRSLAVNVIPHSQKFSEVHPDSQTYALYKVAQFLFSDDILEAVQNIYWNAAEQTVSTEFMNFGDFLFYGRKNFSSLGHSNSLKFLFNEFTSHVSLQYPEKEYVSDLIVKSLRSCQKLKMLTFNFCSFSTRHVLEAISWKSITKLDFLLSSCSDPVIIHVFTSCPDLNVLKASGKQITNKCLLRLCSGSVCYTLRSYCYSKGMCCSFGKNLRILELYGTQITTLGVACALEHLPSLQMFSDGDLCRSSGASHLVTLAIQILRRQYLSRGLPVPSLKLTSVVMELRDRSVPDIAECCPFLRTCVSCGTTALHRISITQHSQSPDVERCHIIGRNEMETDLNFIANCFEKMQPKKFLSLEGDVFLVSDEYGFGYIAEMPRFIKNLEELHLRGIVLCGNSVKRFFTELLSQALNVKVLALSGIIAEECFMNATHRNLFPRLKEVYFHDTDLEKVSLIRLMRKSTELEKVSYRRCKNELSFVRKHREIAVKENIDVIITDDRKYRTRDTAILFNGAYSF